MSELSPERRTLLAFLLSMLVLVVWSFFYKPQIPPKPQQPAPAHPAQQITSPAAPAMPAVPTGAPPRRAATQEKTIVVESDLYRVELSNRGAVVRSWLLKKYTDDRKPPHTLDLVDPEAAQQLGSWPFSLAFEDPQLQPLEAQANTALFQVAPVGTSFRAPVSLEFEWADGRLAVSKRLRFDNSYLVEIETAATLDGRPLAHAIAWRGGFGDTTVELPAEQVEVFFRANGKLQTLAYKKLGVPDHAEQRLRQVGTMDYAGIEDRYFAAAFLPRGTGLALWHWKQEREVPREGKLVKEPVAETAVGTTVAGPLTLRAYVGPKDLSDLGKLNPPLSELVQFGWFGFISEPLFHILKWIHDYVPNYGWAIVLLTVAINMALFPLKVKSWRSMQRMQKVMPEVRAIQDRYKKYSIRDPRKQKMNEEVMAVYKREGINPMGGCLPMVLQMPIWYGLFSMLRQAIELRHAPWFGWIKDLSAHDPYYILPILMTVTMYVSQKMTPVTAADPAQQKMMTLMPVMFGVLFFRMSSGLVLYILASTLVGMAQQSYLNRTEPIGRSPRGKNKKE